MSGKSILTVAVALGSMCIAHSASAQRSDEQAERARNSKLISITYRNLTAGQVFSPSVFFSHNAAAPGFFVEGQPAPFGLQRIAEEGNAGPLLSARLTKRFDGAYGSAVTGISTQPGRSRTVRMEVTAEHPLITGIFMLVMTNDGFAGVHDIDAYNLSEPVTIDLFAYDAGTENNNEGGEYLIAMEGTQRDPENGVIQRHQGLRGDADAPGAWKFDPARPVGRITIAPAR